MKSTGMIRRIDELGRIVIPKEIRRNLGIHDGENIEIFTNEDSIILKKYHRLASSSTLANILCEIIYNDFNYKIMITDREKIIATKGIDNSLLNTPIPSEYLNLIEEREIKIKENYELNVSNVKIIGNFAFIPIISQNDSIGLIIMYSSKPLKDEINIGKLVSSIFSRHLDI
ncbi:MAG: AbrB/MazE/SpoVT family DNA-binding domain-containing protein [Ruminococcus sp.]|nr:AbrB/MazE/SpoVT family DNA-binding domain-containing protein [Ruminococcus sp.]